MSFSERWNLYIEEVFYALSIMSDARRVVGLIPLTTTVTAIGQKDTQDVYVQKIWENIFTKTKNVLDVPKCMKNLIKKEL